MDPNFISLIRLILALASAGQRVIRGKKTNFEPGENRKMSLRGCQRQSPWQFHNSTGGKLVDVALLHRPTP